MNKIITLMLIVFIKFNMYGQYNQTYTNEEFNDNVNTQNNLTKIKLFDINYNGENIPLTLSYAHNGIKPEEGSTNLGMHWKIEHLGYINTTVNYLSDFSNYTFTPSLKGWFNSLDPDFNSFITMGGCNQKWGCEGFNALNENDLSPDFFSVSLLNRDNFDFLYRKNINNGVIGTPTPVFLTTPEGYKINTNFGNFNYNPGAPFPAIDNSIVFNILDNNGNIYDFIKGIPLNNGGGSYNNYYLKSLTNNGNSDFINIDYITKEVYVEKGYTSGYNELNAFQGFTPNLSCTNNTSNNEDYSNNIIRAVTENEYSVCENRLDIKNILTNKLKIDFVYNTNNENLDEINITDINNNSIKSFKFIYKYFDNTTTKTLYQIQEYNTNKTEFIVIYEFEYYNSPDDFFQAIQLSPNNLKKANTDYFGYCKRNTQPTINLLPFDVRNANLLNSPYLSCDIIPAYNYEPDLNQTKYYSLYKIKNKYSGITEFDYQLNKDTSSIYGGGLLVSSIKKIPLVGKTSFTTYTFENPCGFFMQLLNRDFQFIEGTYSPPTQLFNLPRTFKFFTSIPKINDNWDLYPGDYGLYNIHKSGNFFNKVTVSNYDFDTMLIESSTIIEYISNYEGIYRSPVLRSMTYKNSLNQSTNIIEYLYDFQTIETINRAEYKSTIGKMNFGGFLGLFSKTNNPISINRQKLMGITKETFSSAGTITENTSLSYINNNSKLLRSKTTVSTLGDNMEEIYYYPTDTQVASEPLIANLISQNAIGIPLKIETYRGTEKITEQKTVYANDVTTSNLLLPKYIYAKKGTDANSTLEKQITYDKYDSFGNLLQYTQENGIPVSMIWGYNNTQIIAKIENKTYATITPTSLITNAQNASNINNNEANLLLALNAIRTNASLATAFVTTFTYKPLIGISTVTDAKGDKITYAYDSYNRLESVKDKNNNILSENQYNYKPQN